MRKSFTYDGRRYYIRAKDETDYEVKKALKLKELEENKIIESNMLVRDWASEWLRTYKSGSCNDKTYKDYERGSLTPKIRKRARKRCKRLIFLSNFWFLYCVF